jgi:hypothetical protein
MEGFIYKRGWRRKKVREKYPRRGWDGGSLVISVVLGVLGISIDAAEYVLEERESTWDDVRRGEEECLTYLEKIGFLVEESGTTCVVGKCRKRTIDE